jgi:Mg-chelatase subunit ChlI
MLAMADANGIVKCSIKGLVNRARVDMNKVIEAIELFSSPDKYSLSKDFDGRRIAEYEDGGWIILNYDRYRKKVNDEIRKEQKRNWWRNNRSKLSNENKELDTTRHTSHKQKQKEKKKEREKKKKENIYTKEFEQFWENYPKKVAKGAANKALKAVVKAGEFEEMMTGLKQFRFSPDPQYIPNPATWLNQRRWEDEVVQTTTTKIKYDG